MVGIDNFMHPSEAPGVVRRLGSALYETLLISAVLFLTTLAFTVAIQAASGTAHRSGLQVLLFLVLGTYFVWFWSRGQTVAMKTWHIHLRTSGDKNVGLRTASLRYLFAWVFLLPPIVGAWYFSLSPWLTLTVTTVWWLAYTASCLLRNDRQLIHDVCLGTKLVHIVPPSKSNKRGEPTDDQ